MKKIAIAMVFALSGAMAAGCDGGKKEAEEKAAAAKKIADEAAAKAAEDAKAAAAKAAEEAKGQIAAAQKTAEEGLAALGRKEEYLNGKLDKLKGPAKAKVEPLKADFEKAKGVVTEDIKGFATATAANVADVATKAKTDTEAATKALGAYEAGVEGKKK